ncbi:glycosyltransferase [Hymenobacter pini]|uniref:glycosyltransferase n=1 Tax=Hymenobacter pini TaxID=2880879 RepID=UPI001CF3210A|nr:glycosyltransferase [Hymenobacter pini]MCA8832828.1 glycosyltransferase [Hymenobacter pini]
MSHATPLRFHLVTSAGAAIASCWHKAAPPASDLRASVIIPAKNEGATIAATLAALAAQTDLNGYPLPPQSYEVLLLVNNCADDTALVAHRWSQQHPELVLHIAEITLPAAEAHVGRARRILMDEACRRLETAGTPDAFIASTDADTLVAPTWLAATAAALAAGADAVGGRILMLEKTFGCPVRRLQLLDATYHLLCTQLRQHLDPTSHDPWPRHHQHFGASLAVTTAAYRCTGGLPVVPYLEDEALYQALLRHGLRVRHSPTVQVFTSARRQGRVPIGLSWQLREWAELAGEEPMVPHPAGVAAEARLRWQLRTLWERRNRPSSAHSALAQEIGLLLSCYSTFGAFWEACQPYLTRATTSAPVRLSEAVQILRRMIKQTRRVVPRVVVSKAG